MQLSQMTPPSPRMIGPRTTKMIQPLCSMDSVYSVNWPKVKVPIFLQSLAISFTPKLFFFYLNFLFSENHRVTCNCKK